MTVLSVNGVAPDRRNSVKTAILSAATGLRAGYEAWVAPARRPPAFIVRIIGPAGFYREAAFAGREPAVEITERLREALARDVPYADAAGF